MEKLKYVIYRFVRFLVKLFYPKITVQGLENMPQEPCVIVANHCQMNGPIAAELYLPGDRAIWCAGEMMRMKTVPAYAQRDFWFDKPESTQWFYKILSHLIAPLCVCIFTKAHTIGVYHDHRVMNTLKKTISRLKEGANIVIFPEHDVPYDHILQGFQDGFVDVARLYYRQTGKKLSFVPMYLAPKLKKMYLLKPIVFDPEAPIAQERSRICQEAMAAISETAKSLPRHKVIGYRKSLNTYNREESIHEKTGG